MITPVMIANSKSHFPIFSIQDDAANARRPIVSWGTYLVFGAINAAFLPIIYFFYVETAGRSLEEIDLIFAKGFHEKISYVRASKELPFLTDAELDEKSREYGAQSSDDDESGKLEDAAEKEASAGLRED